MPEALALCDNFRCLTELQLFSPIADLAPDEAQPRVSDSSTGPAAVGSIWPDLGCVPGLSGLGILGSGKSPSKAAAVNGSSAQPSSAGWFSGRSTSLPIKSNSLYGAAHPLGRDVRQQHLLRGHSFDGQQFASPTSPQRHFLSYHEQQLPAAVDSFQRYKILSSPPIQQLPKQYSGAGRTDQLHSMHSITEHRAENDSWSAGWVLQSLASIGSPIAAGAAGGAAAASEAFAAAAEAAAGKSSGLLWCGNSGAFVDAGTPRGAWSSRVMSACSVSLSDGRTWVKTVCSSVHLQCTACLYSQPCFSSMTLPSVQICKHAPAPAV